MMGRKTRFPRWVLSDALSLYKNFKPVFSSHDEVQILEEICKFMGEFATEEELYKIFTLVVETNKPENSSFYTYIRNNLMTANLLDALQELRAKKQWNLQNVNLLYLYQGDFSQLSTATISCISHDLILFAKKIETLVNQLNSNFHFSDENMIIFLNNHPEQFEKLSKNKLHTYTVTDLTYLFSFSSGINLIKFVTNYWLESPVLRTVIRNPIIICRLFPVLEFSKIQELLAANLQHIPALLVTADAYLRLMKPPLALHLVNSFKLVLPQIMRNDKTFLDFFADHYQLAEFINHVPEIAPTINEFLKKYPHVNTALQSRMAPLVELRALQSKIDQHLTTEDLYLSRNLLIKLQRIVPAYLSKLNAAGAQNFDATLFFNFVRFVINEWRERINLREQLDLNAPCTQLLRNFSLGPQCSPVDALIHFGQKNSHNIVVLLEENPHRGEEIIMQFHEDKSWNKFICLSKHDLLRIHKVNPAHFVSLISYGEKLPFAEIIKDTSEDYLPALTTLASTAARSFLAKSPRFLGFDPVNVIALLNVLAWDEQVHMITTLAKGESILFGELLHHEEIFVPWLQKQYRDLINKAQTTVNEVEMQGKIFQEGSLALTQDEEYLSQAKLQEVINDCITHIQFFSAFKHIGISTKNFLDAHPFSRIDLYHATFTINLFTSLYEMQFPLQVSLHQIKNAFYTAVALFKVENVGIPKFSLLLQESLRSFDRALLAACNLRGYQEISALERLNTLLYWFVYEDSIGRPPVSSLAAINLWAESFIRCQQEQQEALRLFDKPPQQPILRNLIAHRSNELTNNPGQKASISKEC